MFGIINALLFFPSGALYPVDSYPPWLRAISNIDPLTYGLESLRDLLLRGAPASTAYPRWNFLATFTLVGAGVDKGAIPQRGLRPRHTRASVRSAVYPDCHLEVDPIRDRCKKRLNDQAGNNKESQDEDDRGRPSSPLRGGCCQGISIPLQGAALASAQQVLELLGVYGAGSGLFRVDEPFLDETRASDPPG